MAPEPEIIPLGLNKDNPEVRVILDARTKDVESRVLVEAVEKLVDQKVTPDKIGSLIKLLPPGSQNKFIHYWVGKLTYGISMIDPKTLHSAMEVLWNIQANSADAAFAKKRLEYIYFSLPGSSDPVLALDKLKHAQDFAKKIKGEFFSYELNEGIRQVKFDPVKAQMNAWERAVQDIQDKVAILVQPDPALLASSKKAITIQIVEPIDV